MKLSPSRIKSLLDCSFKFYCNYFLKLPEDQHPKTAAGTLCHLIFEVLKNPRHKHHYDKILKENTVYASKAISKLIKNFCKKNKVSSEISDPIDEMILLGLKEDFFREGHTELHTEYEFNITEENRYEIRGFIDVLAIYDDGRENFIGDYKSQSQKFDKDEIAFNLQAYFYQLAIRKRLGKKAAVEFLLLRHPETKKKPKNHIQRVEPFSDEELDSFENYLEFLTQYLKDYDIKKAKVNFCASNPKKAYFCQYVCQFKHEFTYFALMDGDKIIETSKSKKGLRPINGQRIVMKEYRGCPFFNRQNYAIQNEATKDLKIFT